MKKVLFVDDKKRIRELVSVTLGDVYETFEAESGEQAVSIAKSIIPDLIIMDVMMPGSIDGIEATRILKNDPATCSCKIVLLSGKGQSEDINAGMEAGASDYLVKPFSPTKLICKVEEFLQAG